MSDSDKTRDQLIAELQILRKKVEELRNIHSELKTAKVDQAHVNQQYLELAYNAPVAIFVVQDGGMKIPNLETERCYGLSKAELMAEPLLDLIYKEDREKVEKNYLTDGGFQPGSYLFRINGETGGFKWTELKTISFLWNSKPASLCYQTDISKQKRDQENLLIYQEHLEEIAKLRTTELLETLKKAERANEAKDSFLANMSHEFHTPIHQINSYSQLGIQKLTKAIESEVVVPEKKLLQYFENIHFASGSLFAFITSLFDLVKLEAGDVRYGIMKGSILSTIKATEYGVAEACLEKGLVFEILEPTVSVELEFDQQWLGEVLKHIFSNAVKFSSAGGRIIVSFKQNQIRQFESSQEALQIDISDQGVGIPEEELEFIFEKFTQSSRTEDGSGGRGIGLAICRKIVSDLGGTIHARNNLECGATFSITLPYHQRQTNTGLTVQKGFDSF